jgi:hypothetical protein
MRILKALLVAIVTIALVTSVTPFAALQAAPAGANLSAGSTTYVPSWPKTFDRNGYHVILYQPQVKSWQRYRALVADTAVAITPSGGKTILGVISWSADTITNVSARTVFVGNIQVLSSRFPSLDPVQDAQMQIAGNFRPLDRHDEIARRNG